MNLSTKLSAVMLSNETVSRTLGFCKRCFYRRSPANCARPSADCGKHSRRSSDCDCARPIWSKTTRPRLCHAFQNRNNPCPMGMRQRESQSERRMYISRRCRAERSANGPKLAHQESTYPDCRQQNLCFHWQPVRLRQSNLQTCWPCTSRR